jgi:hypothetical protein
MIPADVASHLRPVLPDQPAPVHPVAPAAKLADVLSDLVPGQRVMAEIQALMPNGTYRAMIVQREVVLSLPSSAKAGDSLELEVVESDGKLVLAFIANRTSGETAGKAGESVSANLSQTGRLIGNLLGDLDEPGKRPEPALLNANQPLANSFPKEAAALVPLLREALAKSGMFYESHQARWVAGQLPTEALLQEPQGKLSTALHSQPPTSLPVPSSGEAPARLPGTHPESPPPATGTGSGPESLQKAASSPQIAPDLAPLVRQQLDALATQNYVWQGQVWPGQQMQWEIEEDRSNRQGTAEDAPQQWYTRLKLTLPILGGIDAVMRLGADNSINVSLATDSDTSRQRLVAAGEGLRRQLEGAGLNLAGLAVHHGETPG